VSFIKKKHKKQKGRKCNDATMQRCNEAEQESCSGGLQLRMLQQQKQFRNNSKAAEKKGKNEKNA